MKSVARFTLLTAMAYCCSAFAATPVQGQKSGVYLSKSTTCPKNQASKA